MPEEITKYFHNNIKGLFPKNLVELFPEVEINF